MNLKLWIRKLATALCLIAITVGAMGAKCNAAQTLQKLQNALDELRLHNRSIAKITNDQFAAGKLDRAILAAVNPACDKFSKALDAGDAAVAAGKLVTEKEGMRTALDYAERIVDSQVFPAFIGVAEAVINVPPEIKAKIETLLASIRAVFATIRIIMGDAQIAIRRQENYV